MIPSLFSVSYAGLWGQHPLDLPNFLRKAASLGYPAVEWRRAGFWYSILHPDDLDWVRKTSSTELAAGRDHVLEYRLVKRDESIVWVRESVVVDPNWRVGVPSRAR